jgi:hypothetical protein
MSRRCTYDERTLSSPTIRTYQWPRYRCNSKRIPRRRAHTSWPGGSQVAILDRPWCRRASSHPCRRVDKRLALIGAAAAWKAALRDCPIGCCIVRRKVSRGVHYGADTLDAGYPSLQIADIAPQRSNTNHGHTFSGGVGSRQCVHLAPSQHRSTPCLPHQHFPFFTRWSHWRRQSPRRRAYRWQIARVNSASSDSVNVQPLVISFDPQRYSVPTG